jgi:NADPH-dependent glutamate synthase beta subunit-like oxidoreductase/NAD-dependent dihydropyrimidine dehydrogenase PreA subunit
MVMRCTDHSSRVEPAVQQFLPPCQLQCPLNEDIQRTNILISLLPEDPLLAHPVILQIGDYLCEQNPLFMVCGYVCGLCELRCNYAAKGGAIRRRLLKRFIAETYTPFLSGKPVAEQCHDKQQVAIVGGGPAGLMAARDLSRRGYRVTVFEAAERVGGALWLIPHYRLPADVLTAALESLVRLAGFTVQCNTRVGDGGITLDALRDRGFAAVFIAMGTPAPRVLTFAGEGVMGQDLAGVLYGQTLLYEENHGNLPEACFAGRRAIVIGGGNVAFDAARTVRRLGAQTEIVCLESADRTSRDRIQVSADELRGAIEEGITIQYGRGVSQIHGQGGKFCGITTVRCLAIYDDLGFNPQFAAEDRRELSGDLLIIAVGQGVEQRLLAQEGLVDGAGRLAVDELTLQSSVREWVFVGGDMLKVGYMAEAMRDGACAAESIDRFLRHQDLKAGRRLQKVAQELPRRRAYRHEPEVAWVPPEQRLSFTLYESGFTLQEAIQEAHRCLACGPCTSCKACIAAGIQDAVPTVEVAEERCSGCGVCVAVCPYGAARFKVTGDAAERTSTIDGILCKGCGSCVTACPAGARRLLDDGTPARVQSLLNGLQRGVR